MLAIAFGQSKYYVDNLSENIRRGQRQKLRSGIWPMAAPLGYLNEGKNKGIMVDPERGPLVAKCFELYATGRYTLDTLKETMTGLGLTTRKGKPVSRSHYHRLLQNHIYYGVLDYGGEMHEGRHPPLITKALFDRVQEVIKTNGWDEERTFSIKPYLYRKMFRCGECDGFITMELQKGHHYLRCTKKKRDCSQRYLREERVNEQVHQAIAEVALPENWIDEMTEKLGQMQAEDTLALTTQRMALQEQVRKINERLERLTSAYLEEAMTLTVATMCCSPSIRTIRELVPALTPAMCGCRIPSTPVTIWRVPWSRRNTSRKRHGLQTTICRRPRMTGLALLFPQCPARMTTSMTSTSRAWM